MTSVSFAVAGYPPAKNEAKSLLASGHVHGSRVLDLLRAAREAQERSNWSMTAGVPLGLELRLTSPAPPPSDATNYLGGVGDVLEDKGRRGDLSHLGELAEVSLYSNDRDFHEVRYRWSAGPDTRYEVRVWTL